MRILRFALLAVAALALAACFDLDQKVSFNRDGSGQYRMVLSAQGAIGDALKSKDGGKDDMLAPNKAKVTTVVKDGNVVKTARVDFRSLSELKLDDEEIGLHVLDRGFFGLTPSHVRFRRTFHVGNARAQRSGGDDEKMGKEVLASMFGDHEYSFAVTLPGSVDRVAPVKIDGVEVKPQISGDFYHGHTIVWRMPLATMLAAHDLSFEVDFSALGSFADAKTQHAKKS